MKIIKGLCCFMLLFMMSLCDASRLISSAKTSVKSIKSSDGDTIDCVHVSHQPALNHRLLKNHKIQMRPSCFPEGLFGESKISQQPITQLWQLNGSCPEGTIPIRRTTQEDLLIASSVKKKLNNISHSLASDNAKHEYASVGTSGSNYYGAKATINVWNPQIQDNDGFSLSQFWIVGGSGENVNTIEAGWMVFPSLFGDNQTRLFTYWTNDNYRSSGCYNLLCSGFVQTSKSVALGASISPLSTYHGSQFDITLVVWKDPKGVWWLQLGNEVIGYWPASLFTDLANSASIVQWGGEVATTVLSGPHTTTQMGSGHFPEEDFGGASYFKNIHVVDASNTLRSPGQLHLILDNPNCYNIIVGHSDTWEDYFYYGGPGRNSNCP